MARSRCTTKPLTTSEKKCSAGGDLALDRTATYSYPSRNEQVAERLQLNDKKRISDEFDTVKAER